MYTMGIDPTQVTAPGEVSPFALGAIAFNITKAGDSKGYILLRTVVNGTVDGQVFALNGQSFNTSTVSTAGSAPGTGQGRMVAIARSAIPNGGTGWFQIYGQGLIRVRPLAVANTQLNTIPSSGVLDDDATAGSRVIEGIILGATNGAVEGNVLGYINWPYVGRTL